MRVVSFQSAVAYGHVGNAGATFALQRLGAEVVRLDTVAFSNHPAHGGFAGGPVEAARLAALVAGLDGRGILGRADAVLTGYLGTAANGAVAADLVRRTKAARPGALHCLDPVMGDRPKGLFVAPDIPAVMADVLLPLADVAVPNAFELELLTGMPVADAAGALAAARALLQRGPGLVVVTGLDAPGGRIANVAAGAEGAWAVTTPRIAAPAYGAGDCFAAILLARWLEHRDAPRALGLATASLAGILARTAARGTDELDLIGAQAEIVAPRNLYPAERIA